MTLQGGADYAIQSGTQRSNFPPEAARQNLRESRILIWLGVIMLLPGIAMTVWSIWEIRTGLSSNTWPGVVGRITESKTQKVPGSAAPGVYEAVVRYKYVVNSQTYANDRVSFRGTKNRDYILATYRTGDKVTVHHAPDDPSNAVLEPGMNAGGLLFYGIVGNFLPILCICALWTGVSKRRTALAELGLLKPKPDIQDTSIPERPKNPYRPEP